MIFHVMDSPSNFPESRVILQKLGQLRIMLYVHHFSSTHHKELKQLP
jgi:hypothetical protein